MDYNAIIDDQLHLFLLLFIKFSIFRFVAFDKWYYLNYSGDRGQKIIPWRTVQGRSPSVFMPGIKDTFKPLKTKFFCLIEGLNAHRSVSTLHLSYTRPVC